MAQDISKVAVAPRGLTTGEDRLLTLDPSGALVEPREIDLSKLPELTIVSTVFEMPELTTA